MVKAILLKERRTSVGVSVLLFVLRFHALVLQGRLIRELLAVLLIVTMQRRIATKPDAESVQDWNLTIDSLFKDRVVLQRHQAQLRLHQQVWGEQMLIVITFHSVKDSVYLVNR